MAFDSYPGDQQQPPSWNQHPGSGPSAPLPPSRRRRDVSLQVVGTVAGIVATLVMALWIISMRPDRTPVPYPGPDAFDGPTCTYVNDECAPSTPGGGSTR